MFLITCLNYVASETPLFFLAVARSSLEEKTSFISATVVPPEGTAEVQRSRSFYLWKTCKGSDEQVQMAEEPGELAWTWPSWVIWWRRKAEELKKRILGTVWVFLEAEEPRESPEYHWKQASDDLLKLRPVLNRSGGGSICPVCLIPSKDLDNVEPRMK